ncbi:MAG: hypothetical protein J6I84_04580 [Bacilli bacterium]|nr:hypothetical protein [Bacilli bacterium]
MKNREIYLDRVYKVIVEKPEYESIEVIANFPLPSLIPGCELSIGDIPPSKIKSVRSTIGWMGEETIITVCLE